MWHRAIVSRAKVMIVEVTTGLPYVHGVENGVHVSEVDYIIDGDDRPAPELPPAAPTDTDRAVAQLIAAEIEDGACLQVGIGAMPNAVCSLLLHSGVRNLGVHTEMMIDGIVDLYKGRHRHRCGQTGAPGKMVCSFGLGSQAMYAPSTATPTSCAARRSDQHAAPHHAQRQGCLHQQHDADGSAGPGGE